METDPSDSYPTIWLYLAEMRAGQIGRPGLQRSAKRLDLKKWPGAMVEFFLKRITEPSLFCTAEDPDPKKKNEQLCEANFFVAQARLIGNDVKGALPHPARRAGGSQTTGVLTTPN